MLSCAKSFVEGPFKSWVATEVFALYIILLVLCLCLLKGVTVL